MRVVLTEKCDLFAANKTAANKNFKWDSEYMSTAVAAVFASLGQTINVDAMKGAELILKKNSRAFSEYRDYAKLPILLQMIRSGNPEDCLTEIRTVYEKLTAKKLMNSLGRMMAALVIVSNAEPAKFDFYVDRTLSIHKRMKEEHCFLTDEADMQYAAILAVSDIPEDVLIRDMECSFDYLKDLFPLRSANCLQSLSHILSLYATAPAEKAARVKEFCEIMKEKKHKLPDGSVLPVYGLIAMMNDNLEQTAEELIDTYDYLKSLNGMGFFSLDSNLRYVYASMIVLNSTEYHVTPITACAADNAATAAALFSAVTMQACMIACMTSVLMISAHST